jgi:hypothetical protein
VLTAFATVGSFRNAKDFVGRKTNLDNCKQNISNYVVYNFNELLLNLGLNNANKLYRLKWRGFETAQLLLSTEGQYRIFQSSYSYRHLAEYFMKLPSLILQVIEMIE